MCESNSVETTWVTYILACSDGTLYTGITTNLERRLVEHNGHSQKGARYTRTRQPVHAVYREYHVDRSAASKREYAIKKMSRSEKLQLASTQRANNDKA